MKIIVNGGKLVETLQQEFHAEFPFLKIEFFQSKTSDKTKIVGNKAFGFFGNNGHSELIDIVPTMTVAELEKNFRMHYGLTTQIFRKSGKAWLETTLTDNWTLQEQNELGKELSNPSKK
ncbi:MAG: hypothetical protein SH857_02295 [Chitinophagales bacterium]|nr:hypothetical protein [Chitinophagales bacterium]